MALVDLQKYRESKNEQKKPAPRPVLLPRQIVVRLSAADAQELEMMAHAQDMTISDVVRKLIAGARIIDPKAIREAIKEMNKIGCNLNQLSHNANKTGHIATLQLTESLCDLQKTLGELRRCLS